MRLDNHVGSGIATTESRKTNVAGMRAAQKEGDQARLRCHISLEKRQLDILGGKRSTDVLVKVRILPDTYKHKYGFT